MPTIAIMSQQPDLEQLAKQFGRYSVDAYLFVQEGLRHAVQQTARVEGGQARHLDAPELVDGVLDVAADRFGMLAASVLAGWGLRRSEDIGAITFQLIEVGVFGKRPQDRLEDFADGPAFATRLTELVAARLDVPV